MRRAGRLYLLAGFVLATVAVVLGIIALQRQREPVMPTQTTTPTTQVVVAARDVRAGSVLTSEDVTVVETDPASVAPGTARQPDQVVGLVVAGDLVAGQRILLANLVLPSVSNTVQPGKRAVAIPVDRINALGGLLQPNDSIDLIYAGRLDLVRILPTEPLELVDSAQGFSPPPESVKLPEPGSGSSQSRRYPYPGEPGSRVVISDTGEGQPVTKIIVQNLRILQVIAGTSVVVSSPGQARSELTSTEPTRTPMPTANEATLPPVDLLIVEADPEQAELISFLLDQNVRYQVILRARGDAQPVQTDGVTYDRLVERYGLPVPGTVVVSGGPR
jgi:pilus assembly protein CpaB